MIPPARTQSEEEGRAPSAPPVVPDVETAPKVWPVSMRLLGLLRTRANFGGALALLRQASNVVPVLRPLADRAEAHLDARAQVVARGFDTHYGTDTYDREHLFQVEVGKNLDREYAGWRTCPINPAFLDEIVHRLPIDPRDFSFVDIGAGKGAAIMMAEKHGFRRLIAIEFSATFMDLARRNAASFEQRIGHPLRVDWVCQDFMTYELPAEPSVFFLNNPFPDAISERALAHLEDSLRRHPRRAIVVWRKVSKRIAARLDRSPVLRPLEWAPYWKAYESVLP